MGLGWGEGWGEVEVEGAHHDVRREVAACAQRLHEAAGLGLG